MASQAEVDLIISTANTLPELERDLERIVEAAEASADPVEIQAVLDRQDSIAQLIDDVTDAISAVNSVVPEIEIEAALDTLESLHRINEDLDDAIDSIEASAEAIRIQAEIDEDHATALAELDAFVAELNAEVDDVEIEVRVDRDGSGNRALGRLGSAFAGMLGPLGKVAAGIAGAGVAAASAVPLMAGLATAVESIAPAAAIAVTGLVAIQLVSGTVKLAMQGVGDAVKSAFDPDVKPEELAKQMKALAPEARNFVLELRKLRKGLKEIQQEIQNNVFKGFDVALKDLAVTTLPILRNGLRQTSLTLNEMALGVAKAASNLGKSGVLGTAISEANNGLFAMRNIPALITDSLGKLAAAAGPSFVRVSNAAAAAAEKINKKLSAAFESGGLEKAIDKAVDALAQFGRAIHNIFEGLGNVFSVASDQGEGLFSTLEKITKSFANVTASKGFQDALSALISVGSTLIDNVLPLIEIALAALGPVFQALGPPLEVLINALGDGLKPVIEALSPVLTALAGAFGRLVELVAPFIDLASKLLVALLPGLVPLFDALGVAIGAMVPFAKQIAETLATALVPIFETLATEVLPKILPPLVDLSTRIFPILTEILIKLAPSITRLAETFTDLLVETVPLIVQLAEMTSVMLDDLMPILEPLIELLVRLATGALAILAFQIEHFVIPALRILVKLLQGDFKGAWELAGDVVRQVTDRVEGYLREMKDSVVNSLRLMKDDAIRRVTEMRDQVVARFVELRDRAGAAVQALPETIRGALGDLRNLLYNAGRDVVTGFINGLRAQLGALRKIAQDIANTVSSNVKGALGIHSPSRVMMEVGDNTLEGFRIGIRNAVPDLRKELQGVASTASSFALPDGQQLRLPQFNQAAPTVQVYLGNELLNQHVDTRIVQSNKERDRLLTTGVRR